MFTPEEAEKLFSNFKEIELQRLLEVRLAARSDAPPSERIVRVLEDLRERIRLDPFGTRLIPFQLVDDDDSDDDGDDDDDDDDVENTTKRGDQPIFWPVTPQCTFADETLLSEPEEAEILGELKDQTNDPSTIAMWMQWNRLPSTEKEARAASFQEGARDALARLRLEYGSLTEDSANAGALLEIYLSCTSETYLSRSSPRVVDLETAVNLCQQEAQGSIQEAQRIQTGSALDIQMVESLRSKVARHILSSYIIDEGVRSAKSNFGRRAPELCKRVTKENWKTELSSVLKELVDLLEPHRTWQLIRQHALLALLPLLGTLTHKQSRWLVSVQVVQHVSFIFSS